MLPVQTASCTSTAAYTFSIPSPPSYEKLDLDNLNWIKVWVALVCMFFDHHMQVATEVQLR